MSNNTTAAESPWGPVDHSQDDVSYQANIIACSVVTWVAAAVFVAARFYTRRMLVSVLGWEDWMILVSLFFAGLTCAGMIEQAVYGLGRHIWTVDPNVLTQFGRSGWYSIVWYMVSLWATKMSILLLYLRILVYPWAKAATYGLIVITILTNIWTLATVFTACVPLAAFWDYTVKGVCHAQVWWWSTTGMHMTTDFMIYVLPTPVIWTLRLRRRQKALLYFIFAFGFFLCVISIIRLIILLQGAGHVDFSWDNIPIAFWTIVETNLAIVCACVMTFKPLVTKIFPNLIDERPRSGDVEQHHGSPGTQRPPTIGTKPTRSPLHDAHDLSGTDSTAATLETVYEDEIAVQPPSPDGPHPVKEKVEIVDEVKA